jgi:hypothetical protein
MSIFVPVIKPLGSDSPTITDRFNHTITEQVQNDLENRIKDKFFGYTVLTLNGQTAEQIGERSNDRFSKSTGLPKEVVFL